MFIKKRLSDRSGHTLMEFMIALAISSLVTTAVCGFFLYIGASDLLPESHHEHPTMWTTFMTVLGVAVLFVAIHFASL